METFRLIFSLFCFITVKPLSPVLDVSILPAYGVAAVYESGTNLTFRCITEMSYNFSYTFLRDNKNISYQTNMDYQLTLPSPSDSGNYTCVTTVKGVSSDESSALGITVIGKNVVD